MIWTGVIRILSVIPTTEAVFRCFSNKKIIGTLSTTLRIMGGNSLWAKRSKSLMGHVKHELCHVRLLSGSEHELRYDEWTEWLVVIIPDVIRPGESIPTVHHPPANIPHCKVVLRSLSLEFDTTGLANNERQLRRTVETIPRLQHPPVRSALNPRVLLEISTRRPGWSKGVVSTVESRTSYIVVLRLWSRTDSCTPRYSIHYGLLQLLLWSYSNGEGAVPSVVTFSLR